MSADISTMYTKNMNKTSGRKYNPYPVQMSRADAFSKAKDDGLITDEEYKEAREIYGDLWFYTGD